MSVSITYHSWCPAKGDEGTQEPKDFLHSDQEFQARLRDLHGIASISPRTNRVGESPMELDWTLSR